MLSFSFFGSLRSLFGRVRTTEDDDRQSLVPLFVPPGLRERRSEEQSGRAPAAAAPSAVNGASPPAALFPPPDVIRAASRDTPATLPIPDYRAASVAKPGDASPPSAIQESFAPAPESDAVRIGAVHFHAPPEGTLQMLPGRLRVMGGGEGGEELRFVRLPGRLPEISFGRREGEPHAHVRLDSPTVSRDHAVLRFSGGRWLVENRSRTNPVLVNGAPLPGGGSVPVALREGDVLEMGEVTFEFRER